MNTTRIEPETCYYITISQLGSLSKEVREALNIFFESDCDVTFGDANRTMLDIPHFLYLVEKALFAANAMDDEERHAGLDEMKNVLEEHSKNVYIDLEN
jgi:hypothetical protein